MRSRRSVAIIAALALTACTQTITGPDVSVIVDQHGTQPGASPSPGLTTGGQLVFGDKVAEFGETCPTGKTPAEDNPRETRVGCKSAVTCSPTDANGSEIKRQDTANFVQLLRFEQLGGTGAGKFDQDGTNAFNGTVVCSQTGVVVLQCTVKDLATGKELKGGDGGNRDLPWTMNCVS